VSRPDRKRRTLSLPFPPLAKKRYLIRKTPFPKLRVSGMNNGMMTTPGTSLLLFPSNLGIKLEILFFSLPSFPLVTLKGMPHFPIFPLKPLLLRALRRGQAALSQPFRPFFFSIRNFFLFFQLFLFFFLPLTTRRQRASPLRQWFCSTARGGFGGFFFLRISKTRSVSSQDPATFPSAGPMGSTVALFWNIKKIDELSLLFSLPSPPKSDGQ